MSKRRIIITIQGEALTDSEALVKVLQVVKNGKISKYKENLQYCYLTTFKDGSCVIARNKKNINTDSFIVI